MKNKVICIHIGARAHYLLPKSLELKGNLAVLITDTWISLKLLRYILNKFPIRIIRSFSSRFSPQIPSKHVRSFSLRFLVIEWYLRYKYKGGWNLVIARNVLFQKIAMQIFKKYGSDDPVLGISYSSLHIFKEAKARGQKTVLFQVDPGLKEERIVSEIAERYSNQFPTSWETAPPSYWTDWKEECGLTDIIMVNSEWSRQGLIEEGIPAKKIKIVPLPFSISAKHTSFKKSYPGKFSKQRPLKCLFLGTLTLRKGIHLVLEAAQQLLEWPVEFILVGQSELDGSLLRLPNVSYKGVATREETDKWYCEADIFLFPTLSDGFGLTQLEAMAWKLPVVASTACGEVVKHGHNGILLNQYSAEELKEVIINCINKPAYVKSLSDNCMETVQLFSTAKFADDLSALVNAAIAIA